LAPLLAKGEDFKIDDLHVNWQKGFKRFAKKESVNKVMINNIKPGIVAEWQEYIGSETEPKELLSKDIVIDVNDKINDVPATLIEFTAPEYGNYLVMAIDSEQGDIDLFVGQLINGELQELNRNNDNSFYPFVDIEVESGAQLAIYIVYPGMKEAGKEKSKVKFWLYQQ